MQRYSIEEFVERSAEKDLSEGFFELESERILEVNLGNAGGGLVWTKMGSMIAYRGDVDFVREGILEHGVGKLLKRGLSGEGAPSGPDLPSHWLMDCPTPTRTGIAPLAMFDLPDFVSGH